MNIDSIKNGLVIDHITAGKSMQIYEMLKLDLLDCSVAVIKNASSRKMGKKDIIKIDSNINVDLDVLGYLSPNATVSTIENGVLVEKRHISPPERIVNVIKCKNPRCITQTEQEIKHVFLLTDREKPEYRCMYCDTAAEKTV